MAIRGYCGGQCGEMNRCYDCELDECIPCSPSCENLTEDGMIKITQCLRDGCEEVKYIFDAIHMTNEELIAEYGEITEYPYDVDDLI